MSDEKAKTLPRRYTDEEDHFVTALAVGTRVSWVDIADRFSKRFPSATAKNLHSLWHHKLRHQQRAVALQEYLRGDSWVKAAGYTEFIDQSIELMKEFPLLERLPLQTDP